MVLRSRRFYGAVRGFHMHAASVMDAGHGSPTDSAPSQSVQPESMDRALLACEHALRSSDLLSTSHSTSHVSTTRTNTRPDQVSYPPRCLLLPSRGNRGQGCPKGLEAFEGGLTFGSGIDASNHGTQPVRPGSSGGDIQRRRQRRSVRVHSNSLFEADLDPADLDGSHHEEDRELHTLFKQLIQVRVAPSIHHRSPHPSPLSPPLATT